MRISSQSSAASCLSSRFRLLARKLDKQKDFPASPISAQEAVELVLANSDFSRELRRYGSYLRNLLELRMVRSISAQDEMFYVLAGLNQCLANSKKISWEKKAEFSRDLEIFEGVVTAALQSTEGRHYYRLMAKALRTGAVFDFDPAYLIDDSTMQLCSYGKARKPSLAQMVGSLAHTTFEAVAELCNVCPTVAQHGSEYCAGHSPSAPGKKGYGRGQRVFDVLYPNRPARGSNPFPFAPHQQWRKDTRGEGKSDPQKRTVWLNQLLDELELQFGEDWEAAVSTLMPTFLARVGNKQAGRALVELIDPLDTYARHHPRYFVKKLKEFHIFVQTDRKIQRRNIVTYEELRQILAENNGSTRSAAIAVGLSQRRVQAILRKGRTIVGAHT